MKVFISQPMNGRSDEDILKEREQIAFEYEETYGVDIEVIDSFLKRPSVISKGRIAMLGDSISLMADADLVIFAPGFSKARGCIVEEEVAKQYGLNRMYYLKHSRKFVWGCPIRSIYQ